MKTLLCGLTWVQFERDLYAAFGEVNPRATAWAKLESLPMGTSMVDKYIQQFKTLADESELDEVTLIHVFECGLHHSVTEKVYGLEAIPRHSRVGRNTPHASTTSTATSMPWSRTPLIPVISHNQPPTQY